MKGLKKVLMNRISLEGQWLGLSAFTDEGSGSAPGWETTNPQTAAVWPPKLK